jgi:ATP-dependent DNA ligase
MRSATARAPENRRLPAGLALDGEIVVWQADRLAFERLQERLNRLPATVARLAAEAPAHFVAFDLLHLGDEEDLTGQPYTERRTRLERVFADLQLGPPWTLCPSSIEPFPTSI